MSKVQVQIPVAKNPSSGAEKPAWFSCVTPPPHPTPAQGPTLSVWTGSGSDAFACQITSASATSSTLSACGGENQVYVLPILRRHRAHVSAPGLLTRAQVSICGSSGWLGCISEEAWVPISCQGNSSPGRKEGEGICDPSSQAKCMHTEAPLGFAYRDESIESVKFSYSAHA